MGFKENRDNIEKDIVDLFKFHNASKTESVVCLKELIDKILIMGWENKNGKGNSKL